MATWRPENSMLTQRGVEILNKLKAGVGSITVTRVVAGSGRVAESLLFQQTSISGVQKPMTISGKNTTDVGSEITFYIENKDFAEPYDLHQIGIYVTHPDYVGEQLYHISQCDANDYDTIPAISYTPVTQGYSIFMEHGNSSSVDITVDPSGMINTVQFNEFKESTNATIQRIKTDVVGLQNKTEYLSNQNLLINWDFGNPVDQRGGYVVPPGETYYTFDWVAAGTTDKYYPVLLRRDAASNYDCEIEIGGTRYVVAGSAAVRGYTNAGITVDRWNCRIAETILITDDGIKVIASSSEGSYCQYLSTAKYQNVLNLLKGNTVTLSALFADGELITNTVTLPESVSKNTNFGIVEKSDGSCSIYLRWYTDGRLFFDVFSAPNRTNDYTLKAIKLELGSYQTLAHKDENGNWVLNEIPDYNEELVKCRLSTVDSSDTYANKSLNEAVEASPAGFGFGGDVIPSMGLFSDDGSFVKALTTQLNSLSAGQSKMVRFQLTYAPYTGAIWYGLLTGDKNYGTLLAESYGGFSGVKYQSSIVRNCYEGVWASIENVNPPMNTNTVYLTNERYNGVPIYKKMDSNGVIWWSTNKTNWKVEAERFGFSESKVMATNYLKTEEVFLEASELVPYIKNLPKMLNRLYRIKVNSGTIEQTLNLEGFYGPGRLWISHKTSDTEVILNGGVGVFWCKAQIIIDGFTIKNTVLSDGCFIEAYETDSLCVQYCTLDGSGTSNKAGVKAISNSKCSIATCTIKNLKWAVYSVCSFLTASAITASGNTIGALVYRGGIILLAEGTPDLIGGSSNSKQGGIIAKGSGSLL